MTAPSGKAIAAKQAAVEVLRSAGEPLKTAEIARRVLEVKDVKLAAGGASRDRWNPSDRLRQGQHPASRASPDLG